MAVSFGVAFAISWIIFKEETDEVSEEVNSNNEVKSIDSKENSEKIKLKEGEILSPITGKSIPMTEVNDSTFAAEVLGKGMAVIPEEGKVCAPVNGKIVTVFDTKHAVGIASDDGTEILIHVGINTVELKGEHFKSHVVEGQDIEVGQLLVEFDIPKIKAAGYDVTTPVIVTNTYDYANVDMVCSGDVKYGDKAVQCTK